MLDRVGREMGKNPNRKMEYRLEFMVLLVFLAAASSVALSREEFAEAMVRKCRKAEMRSSEDQFSSIFGKQHLNNVHHFESLSRFNAEYFLVYTLKLPNDSNCDYGILELN